MFIWIIYFFLQCRQKNNINNNMSKHESNILLYNGDVKSR